MTQGRGHVTGDVFVPRLTWLSLSILGTYSASVHRISCNLGKPPGGRCTNSRSGPMWDNPKLRRFYWLSNRLTALMTDPTVSTTAPRPSAIGLLGDRF